MDRPRPSGGPRRGVAGVAAALSLSVEEAAAGIVAIADANMMGAVRTVSVSRGHDPRDFTLVAFGGAGPLHGVRLAELLDMPAVLVPPAPGVLSTLGLLSTDLRNDYVQGLHLRPPYDAAAVQAAFDRLEGEARAWLASEGVPAADRPDTRRRSALCPPRPRADRAEGARRADHRRRARRNHGGVPPGARAPLHLRPARSARWSW
ncbi:MAG: hydantoinase/oxoprolinase family protein [Dehalococcoidia bacterium]